MPKILRLLLVFFLACLVAACGFHVRDRSNLPPQLNTLYIENSNKRSDLTAQLAENLQELGVQVVKASEQAPVSLSIINDSVSQTSSTLGTAQQLNNITLTYNITFVLRNRSSQNITPPVHLASSTNYFQNANQILGDTAAIPSLEQELIRQNIQKIISYLDANQTRKALAQQPVL